MAKDKKKKQKKLKKLEDNKKTVSKKPEKKSKTKKNKKVKTKAVNNKVSQAEVYETFSRLVQLVHKLSNEPVLFKGNSFHPAELKALEVIRDTQPVSTATLADELKLTRSAVLKTVNKLVHKGVVTKEKSQANGRIMNILLTPEGEDFEHVNSGISSLDKKPVMDTLSKMNEKELAYFNDGLE